MNPRLPARAIDTDGSFDAALVVLAKEPVAGRVKTRLCPPCTPGQAAELARAALGDTLAAVAATPARRRVLVLDGEPGAWLPTGFEVLAQHGDGLDERLAAAFRDVGERMLLVAMDTPQVQPSLLVTGLDALCSGRCDAVLGPTGDGGYWSVGLQSPHEDVFLGVPMSVPGTFVAQRERMRLLGLRVHEQPRLDDVDRMADAVAVSRTIPRSRFAAAVATLT